MKIILILLFSVLNGQGFLDYLSGPITLKVGLVSGYDDNVLRFSDIEKRQASENKLIMDVQILLILIFQDYILLEKKRFN